jgi:hypothetical protein
MLIPPYKNNRLKPDCQGLVRERSQQYARVIQHHAILLGPGVGRTQERLVVSQGKYLHSLIIRSSQVRILEGPLLLNQAD